MTSDGLIVERKDVVVSVRIEAPPQNLFTREMTTRLAALLVSPPEGVHVVHISAAGGAFCLGRAPFRSGVDELEADVQGLAALNRALAESPAVTVAEVHGDCAGFGVGVAALCDVAIASPRARLSFPEVDAGFAPALVLSWLVPMVGRRAAFWLTATGVELPAGDARDLGLLTDVADDPEALPSMVAGAVATLVEKPPSVHREIKRLMRSYAALPDDARSEVAAERLGLGALRRALMADVELGAGTGSG